MRRLTLCALVLGWAAPAGAQLTHELPPADPAHHAHGVGGGAAVQALVGSTTLFGKPASYETIALHGHVHAGLLVAAVHVPVHRLVSSGGTDIGLGDIHLEAAFVIRRATVAAGASVGVGVPTGSRRMRLGMGHAMVMPRAFATVRTGRMETTAALGYARAISPDDEHAGHGALHVVVAPMSIEQLDGTVRARWWLAPELAAIGEVGVAVPLVDEPTRAAIGTGARWHRDRFDVDARVEIGVAGDPFIARGTVMIHFSI